MGLSSSTVTSDIVRIRVSQALLAQHPRGFVAAVPALAVGARAQLVRRVRVRDEENVVVHVQHGYLPDGEVPTVQQKGAALFAHDRDELVHYTTRHPGEFMLGLLAGQSLRSDFSRVVQSSANCATVEQKSFLSYLLLRLLRLLSAQSLQKRVSRYFQSR